MYSFSVGSIAAIVNAAVAILQFIIPNALIIALVATLSETHTAVTWSVVGRSIQSSHWPVLLRADSADSKHIQSSSRIIALLRPTALALLAIAAIVTPLGLYEDVKLSAEPRLVDLVRQADEGPFGLLTPPRSDLGFSRACSDSGGWLPAQCPGTNTVIIYSNDGNTFNATIVNDDYDRRIPVDLAELYQSGLSLQPSSISSFFDIEWRWYNKHTQDNILNHSYLVDSYFPIASVIGDRDIKLIEGLIVDARDGGIGFRSHTVPAAADTLYGAEWDEDIMFFLPETACVDTNVTLEYEVPSEDPSFLDPPLQNIIDRGGFVQNSRHNPWHDGWYGDTQQDPQLRARAYRAAWTMNAFNMFFFNVTEPFTNLSAPIDSHVGKRYPVNNSLSTYSNQASGLMALATLSLDPYNGLVGVPYSPLTYRNASSVIDDTIMSDGSESSWPNPYGINEDNYTVADIGCSAIASDSLANATNIQVKCGMVLGPANKTSGFNTMLVEPRSVWTRPVYMCASTTKATIKTVRFAFNPTRGSGLDRLVVTSITDKQYGSQHDMPIWGVETPNMSVTSINPFWGLIDPQMGDPVNLSTSQADHVYIPASSPSIFHNTLYIDGGSGYMPGTDGPAVIWESAYMPREVYSGLQDLSGSTSLALASMWKNMSATATGTASIMNLIWTDLAANALIGTRGWLSGNDTLPPNLQGTLRKRDKATTSSSDGQMAVYVHWPIVRYRWIYGIPAILCLLVISIICATALVAMASGNGSATRIRYYLGRLSTGRLLLALKLGEHDYDSSAKHWFAAAGGKRLLSLPASGYESVPTEEQHVAETKDDIDPSLADAPTGGMTDNSSTITLRD